MLLSVPPLTHRHLSPPQRAVSWFRVLEICLTCAWALEIHDGESFWDLPLSHHCAWKFTCGLGDIAVVHCYCCKVYYYIPWLHLSVLIAFLCNTTFVISQSSVHEDLLLDSWFLLHWDTCLSLCQPYSPYCGLLVNNYRIKRGYSRAMLMCW